MAWKGWLLAAAVLGGTATAQATDDDFVFIHHSCGSNWLSNSLHAALLAKSYIDERNDITYGTVVPPDAARPGSLGGTPGNNTNMNHWILWFNDYLAGVKAHGCASGVNRIIMFKSCYPISNVGSDGTEPGSPFSGTQSLVNYKSVLRHPDGAGNTYSHTNGYTYRPLEDVFAANPDTLFIFCTAPPLHWGTSSDANAHRARLFNTWAKADWLDSYNAAHPGLNNVAVFDWFNFLAYPDGHPDHPNRLTEEYGGDSGNSHPNTLANQESTAAFATDTDNFIDPVWLLFSAPAVAHVDDDNTTGTEDGSPEYPYDTIQEAIDAVAEGGTVKVAGGIYTEVAIDGRTCYLRGGYVGGVDYGTTSGDFSDAARDPSLHTTTIDAGRRTSCVDFTGGAAGGVSGFYITNGQASLGGGVNIDHSDVVVAGNIIEGNIATSSGGGVSTYYGTTQIVGNRIVGNGAGSGGGVLFYGGSGAVTHCIVSGNTGKSDGGAGAGLAIDNTAVQISHCTAVGNRGAKRGGGLYNGFMTSTVVRHCIFWGNDALESPEIHPHASPGPTIGYSTIQGGLPAGCTDGGGNLASDPLLAVPGQWTGDAWTDGDYHLRSPAGRWEDGAWVTTDTGYSPCIDAGAPGDPIGDEPAPNGGVVNLGAYGGTAEASKSLTVRPPGALGFDLRVVVAGRLNVRGPGSRSVTAETLDANGNPPEARYAIQVEGLGWLVVAGDTASPEGADPDFQPLSTWEGIRVLGLLAGVDYTFWAVARVGDDESPAVAVGSFTTNRACDVNRSGIATALDYAYIRAATLRGGTLGLDISWACDVTGNGSVGVADLALTRDAILHP